MNYFIKKHDTGFNEGNFVLHGYDGTAIESLGDSVELFVRRCILQRTTRIIEHIKYVVEVVGEPCRDFMLAELRVPVGGADTRIAMSLLKADGMGSTHQFGLMKVAASEWVMTIDGLLWDGKIIHRKDIVR